MKSWEICVLMCHHLHSLRISSTHFLLWLLCNSRWDIPLVPLRLLPWSDPHGSLHVDMLKFQWHPTPVLLPGESHGRRSLMGCSPWGRWGSDMTERLCFHFSLSCIGEGNGNPLQCSCLENPRDGGAWWAVIYGVTQSRTQLKRFSSSSMLKFQS